MLVAPDLAGTRRQPLTAVHGSAVAVGVIVLAAAVALIAAPAWAARPVRPAATPAETPVPTPTAVTPEERAVAISAPAVILLEVHWEGWVRNRSTGTRWDERLLTITTRCTGVAVSNDGYIITTGHCVDAGPDGVAPLFFEQLVRRQVDEGTLPASQAQTAVQDMLASSILEGPRVGDPLNRKVYVQRSPVTLGATTGDATEAKVVTLHPGGSGDLALLKVERSNQPMLRLAGALPEDGLVLVLGYPAITPSVSGAAPDDPIDLLTEPGTVTPAPTPSPAAEPDDMPQQRYLTSASDLTGVEGAPVLDFNGDVVGLLTLDSPAGAPFARIVANPDVLAEDLESNEVLNDLGRIDNDYRGGLDAYYDGRYDECILHFDHVLAALPSHRQAQELRQQAVALREIERDAAPEVPDNNRMMLVGGGSVAALLVIAAVAGAVLWRRRRIAGPSSTGRDTAHDAARARDASAGMRYCPNCSRGWPPGTATCEKCGRPLS